MSITAYFIWCSIGFCIFIVVILAMVYSVEMYNKIYEKMIATSKRYLYLHKLESSLKLYDLSKQYSYTINFDTKAKYDRTEPFDYLVNLMIKDPNIVDIVNKAFFNGVEKEKIQKKIDHAPSYSKRDSVTSRFYLMIEKKNIKKIEKRIIPIIPSFKFRFQYISPAGQNHYWYDILYQLDDMLVLLSEAQRIEQNKKTARYQRSLMSSALRYDVMKRDGFRCVLCGRSAEDGIKLHVDHIVPISKGGKTTIDNLRTLCSDCNIGKKDKFDSNGLN